jgi:SHS family lactate transporter-like MFS transporter
VIPIWAFSSRLVILALGAFLMQVGVQGAWGIIPAHLNELSPDSVRGMLPGFAYQIGILFASPTNTIEYALRDRLGYSWALASFEIAVMVLLALTVFLGSENRGKNFLRPAAEKVSA